MTRTRWRIARFLWGMLIGSSVLVAGQALDNSKPVAFFQAFRGSEINPTVVLLDGTQSSDSDGDIVSYQWVFGDGTTGSGVRVEHSYSQVDQFAVTLVVIDDRGASHMITKSIDLTALERQDETAVTNSNSQASAPPPVVGSSAPEGHDVGNRAPDFTLPTLDGGIAHLSTYLGQVVIIDFWFLTCSGCVASLPHLSDLQAQFEDEGLVVLVLVLDRDPDQARKFFADSEYTGFILAHEHDWSRPTRTTYDVGGTPHSFVVDRSGVIRFSGKPNNLTAELIERLL